MRFFWKEKRYSPTHKHIFTNNISNPSYPPPRPAPPSSPWLTVSTSRHSNAQMTPKAEDPTWKSRLLKWVKSLWLGLHFVSKKDWICTSFFRIEVKPYLWQIDITDKHSITQKNRTNTALPLVQLGEVNWSSKTLAHVTVALVRRHIWYIYLVYTYTYRICI